MFDLRYHVASLAAVFIALAVGVVVGVAIASGGSVEDTTKSIREQNREQLITSLRKQLDETRSNAAEASDEQQATLELMDRAYPALMAGRLESKNVAVLFVGTIDRAVRSAIERTLTDAGAGLPVRLTALELPADSAALEQAISADPALAAFGSAGGLEGLGRGLGRELIDGEETPVWDAVRSLLVEELVGSSLTPADAVVVVRTWLPEDVDGTEASAADTSTEELVSGILQGLQDSGIPTVGVERAGADPSALDGLRAAGLSTVDNVDALPGRVALAVLLAGGTPGSYGTGDGVQAVSPPIEPVPETVTSG